MHGIGYIDRFLLKTLQILKIIYYGFLQHLECTFLYLNIKRFFLKRKNKMFISTHAWCGVEWSGIPITDWIIAVAAVGGIYYAARGYYRLIEDNRNQQKQI